MGRGFFKGFYVESLFAFLEERAKSAVFIDFKCFHSKLKVCLKDESVLEVDQLRNLSHLIWLLFISDHFLYVFRDVSLHSIFILIHEPIVKDIGTWSSISSKCFVNFVNVALRYSLIVENVPFPVLKRFDMRCIMTGIRSSTVNQDRVQLINQRTLLQILLNKLGILLFLLFQIFLTFNFQGLFLGDHILELFLQSLICLITFYDTGWRVWIWYCSRFKAKQLEGRRGRWETESIDGLRFFKFWFIENLLCGLFLRKFLCYLYFLWNLRQL